MVGTYPISILKLQYLEGPKSSENVDKFKVLNEQNRQKMQKNP